MRPANSVISFISLLIPYMALGLPLGQVAHSAEFAIARQQDLKMADITTHEIRSGDVVLGISEFGGGYINKLYIPAIGDVLAKHSALYGRGGQVAIRDQLHGGRYNPTQAGFSDSAGTHCVILQPEKGVLLIPPRPLALWNGDAKYDFTEWEDLAADPYRNDGGNSDSDNIDESKLGEKQASEITSEFDFTASYKDVRDGKNILIPAFQFQYEFRFARQPGHAIKQFMNGTPAFKPAAKIADRSNLAPPGDHPSAEDSLSGVILASMLRGDKSVWDPSVVFTVDKAGKLMTLSPTSEHQQRYMDESRLIGHPLIIISTSPNPKFGPAIGYYHPFNHVNQYSIVGRAVTNDSLAYEDARTTSGTLVANFSRTKYMWQFGARTEHTGLLNRKETPKGVYEAIRGESYILVGTPNEIFEAAQAIQRGL